MKSVSSWRSDASGASSGSTTDRGRVTSASRRRAKLMHRNNSSGERGIPVGRPLSGSEFVSDMKSALKDAGLPPPAPPPFDGDGDDGERKYHKVVDELICNEIDYHDTLKQLLEKYVAGVAATSAGKGGEKITGLSKEDCDIIFGGLKPILEVSSRALSKIEALEDVHEGKQVAEVFVQLAPNFAACYSWYASCYTAGLSLLRQKMKGATKKMRASSGANVRFPRLYSKKRIMTKTRSMSSFVALWNDAQGMKECANLKGQSLESLLIMPIQHVPRYKLLFAEMVKKAEKDRVDEDTIAALKSARDAMNHTATFINNSVKKRQKLEGVMGKNVTQEKESPIAVQRRRSKIIETERKAFLRTLPTQLIRSAEWTPSMATNIEKIEERRRSSLDEATMNNNLNGTGRRGTKGSALLNPRGTYGRQRSFTDSGRPPMAPTPRKSSMSGRPKLIRIWSADHDAFYHYNSTTGESTWEGADGVALSDTFSNEEVEEVSDVHIVHSGDFLQSRTSSEPPLPETLPQGWSMHLDPTTHVPYYYNDDTGESTWTRPW